MANFDDGVAPERVQRRRTKGWRMPLANGEQK